MKHDKAMGNDQMLNQVVEKLIADYRAQNQITEPHSRVLPISGRAGVYDVDVTNETAEILLHQLTTADLCQSKINVESEQERLEVEEPPLLVLAKQVRTFTTYFCGMKRDKPVWAYQEFLAARFDFAQAEKMVTTLGDGVFALPATERRAVASRKSW